MLIINRIESIIQLIYREAQDENVLIEISFSEQIINVFKVSIQNMINSSTSTDTHVRDHTDCLNNNYCNFFLDS